MTAVAIASRGYHAIYRPGSTNFCPGCGRSHWHVGRTTAECGFCATALPLEGQRGSPSRITVVTGATQ